MLINDASITGSLIVNASSSFQNIAVSGNILPGTNNVYNLGSVNKYFKEIFVSTGSINFVNNGSIATTITSVAGGGIQIGSVQITTSSISFVDSTGSVTQTIAQSSSAGSTSNFTTTASFNSYTSSNDTTNTTQTGRLNNLETKSASVDISITNINSFTSSNNNTSLNSFTSSNNNTSLNSYTSSQDTKNTTLGSYTGSIDTKWASISNVTSSLIAKTGSYATTGSNSFYGTQVFSGSVYIANDLVVQGSSSIQYISASSVSIGTNIIQLNTANPSVRFAGLTMIDSGSVGGSGSFLYDSLQDEFIFVHRGNGTNVTSSHFVTGPETYDNLGNELYLTCNVLTKGTGKEHLVDSCIFDNGTTTCIKNNLVGTGTACFIGAATFTGNITVDKSSPNISINAPTGTSGQYNINNGVGSLMWAMYSTTGGGNSQGNFGLYSAGKTGGAGAIIDITPTGAAAFSSTLSATTGYFSCNVIIDNQSLNNAKYLQFDANISSGANALLGDIRWYNKQWDSSIKAQIVALTDTDITNGRLSFRTGTDGVNAIERLRISSTGISCFQNTICAPLFTTTNGVVAIGAGPSSTEIFTATGPSSSNGMYLIIYSQQGTPGSATGMAYINIWNNASVDVYNIFCQSLSNVTNAGTSVKIQALSGNGGFTAVYSVIRLR